ncbi:hypothetical protein Cni_G02291 [Canna indica]|uniref:Uncharacterized protein n=1 Tax=Canna indica TaxID=4628 RepID=A0AAQ3JPG8_9LILI|nr:hypothetical protein Cni_G02291 [Canna indica]
MACGRWREVFLNAAVQHLVSPSSDHVPLLMQIVSSRCEGKGGGRRFRFENMWLRDDRCLHAWKERGEAVELKDEASGGPTRASALSVFSLGAWNRHSFGNVQHKIKQCQTKIDELSRKGISGELENEERNLMRDWNELLEREETLWRQRSRVLWLKDVDRNTKFFHARAFSRRRKNQISGLRDEYGCWRAEVKPGSSHRVARSIEVLEAIEPVVSQADNEVLLMPFQKDEIRMGLIKECVTTVSYSILFEGLEVGPIFPQRGLRQALSPYLFIICAEGFHALLRKAEREGLIHGVKSPFRKRKEAMCSQKREVITRPRFSELGAAHTIQLSCYAMNKEFFTHFEPLSFSFPKE